MQGVTAGVARMDLDTARIDNARARREGYSLDLGHTTRLLTGKDG